MAFVPTARVPLEKRKDYTMQDSKCHSEDCHDRMQTPAGASRFSPDPGRPRGSFRQAVWLVGNLAQVNAEYQMKIVLQSGNYGGQSPLFQIRRPCGGRKGYPDGKLSTFHLNDCKDLRRRHLITVIDSIQHREQSRLETCLVVSWQTDTKVFLGRGLSAGALETESRCDVP